MAPYQHSPQDTPRASQERPLPQTKHRQSKPKPSPSPSELVKTRLYKQYREWKGTRYQFGGMSKRGIDCSALVLLTYRDHMGIQLPRTTRYQARAGKAIKRNQLRTGDLVFFKTGRRGRHVGIYIENGQFLHASVSRGVTISHLSEHYWNSRYWRARRLDFEVDS